MLISFLESVQVIKKRGKISFLGKNVTYFGLLVYVNCMYALYSILLSYLCHCCSIFDRMMCSSFSPHYCDCICFMTRAMPVAK